MPFQYRVYAKYKLGYGRLTGVVTGDELVRAVLEMTSHPYWEPEFNTLWDGRPIQQLNVGVEELNRIISIPRVYSERFGPGKAAMVVTRDLDYSVSKLISMRIRRENRETRVFREFDEAVKWLQLPMPLPFLG